MASNLTAINTALLSVKAYCKISLFLISQRRIIVSNVQDVTDQNFEQEVIKSGTPVLVDFWAAWCGPCRMIVPAIDAIAEQYKDKLKVVKLNVDENPKTAGSFSVMSIPTLLFFKDGKEADRFIGLMSKEDLSNKLSKHI